MTESMLLDALTGSGEGYPGFPDLDQRFHLKLRSYVDTAMPQVFRQLGRTINLVQMRREGIYPIMYYMTFEPAPQPVAFGRPVRADYEAHLRRYRPAPGGGPPGTPSTDRLLIDVRFQLKGHAGLGRADDMGPGEGGKGGEPTTHVGTGRIVQVMTRPLAPAGQRQVTELPEAYRCLREMPWSEPYPTWEAMALVPPGFSEPLAAEVSAQESVWGIANTDINQHVNIVEYLSAVENHQSRVMAAAGLPPERHRVTAARMIFLKPFFAGEAHRVAGTLRRKGDAVLFLGGVYKVEKGARPGAPPAPEARPGVFMRYEGVMEGLE